MIQEFQKGRTEPFHYEAKPYGKTILATLYNTPQKLDSCLRCKMSIS